MASNRRPQTEVARHDGESRMECSMSRTSTRTNKGEAVDFEVDSVFQDPPNQAPSGRRFKAGCDFTIRL